MRGDFWKCGVSFHGSVIPCEVVFYVPRFLIMKPGKDFKAGNPHVSLAKMAHGMSSKMSVSFTRLHHVLLNHNSGRGEQDPSSKY